MGQGNVSGGGGTVEDVSREGSLVVIEDFGFSLGSELANEFAFALGSFLVLLFSVVGILVGLMIVLFYLSLPYLFYRLNEEIEQLKKEVSVKNE